MKEKRKSRLCSNYALGGRETQKHNKIKKALSQQSSPKCKEETENFEVLDNNSQQIIM